MRILAVLFLIGLGYGITAEASPRSSVNSVLEDRAGLLSSRHAADIAASAKVFERATGYRMIFVIRPNSSLLKPDGFVQELAVYRSTIPVGIVYVMSPGDKSGTLLIHDPAWRKVVPAQWGFMFPQRLAQKFGDEPFERRVVLSAQYLATVFPDKLAFVMKPRGGSLSPGSVQFSQGSYIGLQILGFFIIGFTVFRTFWPARIRDEDQDEFSNELRRLKKERQIW